MEEQIGAYRVNLYGNKTAARWVLQPADVKMKTQIEAQYCLMEEKKIEDVCLVVLWVHDWNAQLSPWSAPPVFGEVPFAGEAEKLLSDLQNQILPGLEKKWECASATWYLAGYSLAGLFALWTGTKTSYFAGVIAASPSVWFTDWLKYASENPMLAGRVYLSLGDKEAKTKNKQMQTVADAIEVQKELLLAQGVEVVFEWNQGNHFKEADLRVVKGMRWMFGNKSVND